MQPYSSAIRMSLKSGRFPFFKAIDESPESQQVLFSLKEKGGSSGQAVCQTLARAAGGGGELEAGAGGHEGRVVGGQEERSARWQEGRRAGGHEGVCEITCRGLPRCTPPGQSHSHHTQSSPSLGVGNVW